MMESKTISETIQSNKRKRKRNSNKIEYARDTEREGERERGRQVGIKIKPRFGSNKTEQLEFRSASRRSNRLAVPELRVFLALSL